MQFKHSLSIFSSNLALTYKVLILIFIVIIIASALMVSIFNPLFKGIKEAVEFEGISLSIREIMENPLERISDIWNITANFLSDNTSLIASRLVFLFLLIVITRFFISIALVPITKIIHSKMTTGYSGGLFSNLVATLAESIVMAILSSIIFAILDIAILILAFQIFFWFFKVINVSALLIAFGFFIVFYSARITLFSQWLSVISDGQRNVFKALVTGIKLSLKCFMSHYVMVLTTIVVFGSIVTVTSIPTFGLLPIVAFPMTVVLLCIFNLTSYFNIMNRKYYTDDGVTVYDPKK